MRRAWAWLIRPHVLGPLALGVGAAGAVLVLGVPSLATPTAAGWAAALGSLAAAGVALYLGRIGIASSTRLEATHTVALAVMVRPFLDAYTPRITEAQAAITEGEGSGGRDAFAAHLMVSAPLRRNLTGRAKAFFVPGMAELLNSWSGAHPDLVREVARLESLVNRAAVLMRRPLEVAPRAQDEFEDAFECVAELHGCLEQAANQVLHLRQRCSQLAP